MARKLRRLRTRYRNLIEMNSSTIERFDVVIIGGGPAGLSAATWLGRCRRRVLLCSSDAPRNMYSRGLHGFLTCDSILPGDFLRTAREQLRTYDCVEIRQIKVENIITHSGCSFEVELHGGERVACRRILIATGIVDELPDIPGVKDFYGASVHHCPYCDGWEQRDKPLAVYGCGKSVRDLALLMTIWSSDVMVCSHGPAELSNEDHDLLALHNIPVFEQRIVGLEGPGDGALDNIFFDDGTRLHRKAIFFTTGRYQHSDLCAKVGCNFNETGLVATGQYQVTNVPGVYVAGDAAGSMQLAIVAASEGAQAAVAINIALHKEDLAAVAAPTH
jgi:thioredoxin reductase